MTSSHASANMADPKDGPEQPQPPKTYAKAVEQSIPSEKSGARHKHNGTNDGSNDGTGSVFLEYQRSNGLLNDPATKKNGKKQGLQNDERQKFVDESFFSVGFHQLKVNENVSSNILLGPQFFLSNQPSKRRREKQASKEQRAFNKG
jgi:hypothetical protein